MKLYLSTLLLTVFAVAAMAQEKLDVPPRPLAPNSPLLRRPSPDKAEVLRKAQAEAVTRLKAMQKKDGGWEPASVAWGGHTTATAIEALLANDVDPNDPVIVSGLKNLRGQPRQDTSVVSGQIVTLCKANNKKDQELVQTGVDWLRKAARHDIRGLLGWGSTGDREKPIRDIQTFYAVLALRSARQAGIEVERQIWKEIRELYLATQEVDGGWTWFANTGNHPSRTPLTLIAIFGLLTADEQLGSSSDASKKAIKKGFDRLVKSLHFDEHEDGLSLYALAHLAQICGESKFVNTDKKQRDWFDDGCVWIFNHRAESGYFYNGSFNPARTTSSALLFLAAGK